MGTLQDELEAAFAKAGMDLPEIAPTRLVPTQRPGGVAKKQATHGHKGLRHVQAVMVSGLFTQLGFACAF